MAERVAIYLDRERPSARALAGYFAEVFAELDARPRTMLVYVHAANEAGAEVRVEIEKGEPVFRVEGSRAAHAHYRGRWLAEHPSPLVFSRRAATKLLLTPTSGNRVKVRRANLLDSLWHGRLGKWYNTLKRKRRNEDGYRLP